ITTPTKPGSALIELCPPMELHGGYSGPVAPNPLGVKITAQNRMLAVLKVIAANSANGLDIYFQQSSDDGQTWSDFAHVQVAANTTGTWYVPISSLAAGATSSLVAVKDGTLTANTAVQGPVGDRIRIKYTVGASPLQIAPLIHAYLLPN